MSEYEWIESSFSGRTQTCLLTSPFGCCIFAEADTPHSSYTSYTSCVETTDFEVATFDPEVGSCDRRVESFDDRTKIIEKGRGRNCEEGKMLKKSKYTKTL